MNALAKISRNMTLTGDPASPGEIERRIRASQIDVMFTASTMAVLIGYFAALLLAILMIVNYGASILAVEIWIALHSLSFLVRFAISFLYRRRDAEAHNEAVYAMAFAAASMASALAWSLGSHFILCPTGLEQETIANLSLLGLGAGAVLSLCSYAPALFAYFLPLTLPVLGFALRQNDTFHQTFSGLAAAFIAGMLMLALRWNVTLSRSLRLDLEKRELIDDLSEQKELAVKANQSKSRFLAAASHDLRQPVHALSMFVGALRERALDPGSARLVEQITGSIETLDTLFGSLLDISRLDAGVVSHREEDFAIEPLIARVCDDFAIDAQSKHLGLTRQPTSLAVRTDPVLLETILRNVLSNAVRYTDRGRILVGCRRSGARLRLDVIDTGRGIAQRDIERIFEEYYQVGNPERDRAKGLGLGLAIVKRIAALIKCEVEIESKLGRGTRFSIHVPLSFAARAATAPSPPVSERAVPPGVVFVIDDELSIRRAMGALLMSWGHRVVVAGSGEEILAVASISPLRPDLLICDLRLRDGENGIRLMDQLRSEYNDELPGILITGDTAAERLAEARESGYLILHKPVSSAKLRAAMTTLLASRAAARAIEPALTL